MQTISAAETGELNNKIDEKIKPCMNIKYSANVIDCIMKEAKESQQEYAKEFNWYLGSTKNKDEINHNKDILIIVAKKAPKGVEYVYEKLIFSRRVC